MNRTAPVEAVTVRVISLLNRGDRRAKMREDLKSFAPPWSFFDACTEASPCRVNPDEAEQLRRFGRRLSPGEVGCFKSHYNLLEQFAQQSETEWLLVLEDDVWPDPDFDYCAVVAFCARRQIRYLRLYAKFWKPARHIGKLEGRNFIRFLTDPYGTQGYLIDRAGAARLLASIRSIDMPIDDEMGRFWTNGLVPYAIYPFPLIERSSVSSIAGERAASGASPRSSRLLLRVRERAAKMQFNARLKQRDRALFDSAMTP